MVGILEGLALGFVVLTAVYLLVSVYSRSVHRERLEKEFDSGGIAGDREAFIAAGLAAYAHSLRRKLILLVYFIPALAVAVIIYLNDWQ
jgi:Ca2+/Na+ antiporter